MKDPRHSASDCQACFPMGRAQVDHSSIIGFKGREVAVGSPRPEYPECGSRESGVGVPDTAIRISISKPGGVPSTVGMSRVGVGAA